MVWGGSTGTSSGDVGDFIKRGWIKVLVISNPSPGGSRNLPLGLLDLWTCPEVFKYLLIFTHCQNRIVWILKTAIKFTGTGVRNENMCIYLKRFESLHACKIYQDLYAIFSAFFCKFLSLLLMFIGISTWYLKEFVLNIF